MYTALGLPLGQILTHNSCQKYVSCDCRNVRSTMHRLEESSYDADSNFHA